MHQHSRALEGGNTNMGREREQQHVRTGTDSRPGREQQKCDWDGDREHQQGLKRARDLGREQDGERGPRGVRIRDSERAREGTREDWDQAQLPSDDSKRHGC
jgi:hypothetical protein